MAVDPLPAQIDYTSRDYVSIREDLIARVQERIPAWRADDPSDFGVALVEAFAHLGDLMSYYIDRVANESTLSTATRRESVVALARDLGYVPFGFSPSRVVLTFINSGESPIVIPAGTRVAANIDSGDAVLNIPFETDEAVTVEPGVPETVIATQGFTVLGDTGYGEEVGMSDGLPSQEFELSNPNVVTDSVRVYVFDNVNFFPWQRVDHFADYGPLSRVFRVIDDGSQTYRIQLGDGVSGLVPTATHRVFATYRVVDGTFGNVPAGSIVDVESIPGLTDAELATITGNIAVINDVPATGGVDPQDTEAIRRAAARLFRAGGRAVTLEDYQNTALGVSGCGKASAQSETPSLVGVIVSPARTFGTAEPRPGYEYDEDAETWSLTVEQDNLRERVQKQLDLVSLAGVTTTVLDPQYVDVVVQVTVDAIPSVRRLDAEVLIKQAILERFDYTQVQFGSSIYASDLVSLISSLGITQDISVDVLKISGDPDDVYIITAEEDEVLTLTSESVTVNVTGGVEDSL